MSGLDTLSTDLGAVVDEICTNPAHAPAENEFPDSADFENVERGKQCGPGYQSPTEAINGPKEKLLYITCVNPRKDAPDFLATVDVDPSSKTYQQIIHRLYMLQLGDELHHFGWNSCSSCHGDVNACRDKLILPALLGNTVYFVDVKNPRKPALLPLKTISPANFLLLNISAPHTTHCLPTGEIMISIMGDAQGKAQGNFLILDAKTLLIKGLYSQKPTKFGYDFWYQPKFDVMISTQWGAPKAFKKEFNPSDITAGYYGHELDVWAWTDKKYLYSIDLGTADGLLPLEIRFLHNPEQPIGYVACAISSTVFYLHRNDKRKWVADLAIKIPSKMVSGWVMNDMPGVITDILVSMDDRFLFLSNWVHGDIRCYSLDEPSSPQLVSTIWIGGSIYKGGKVTVMNDPELSEQPDRLVVKNRPITGGPQMLQLSLDGTRLYVTTSLFSAWDKQFYPDLITTGAVLLQINVDEGQMTLNEDFLVDFGNESSGPYLAHEMRYPGGDCSSDIFLPCN